MTKPYINLVEKPFNRLAVKAVV
uniref:Uncharacterized protein n=1 Tax=Anguilla anguilla TaxID=7936 RepID=A0A0E9URI1_ANGAN